MKKASIEKLSSIIEQPVVYGPPSNSLNTESEKNTRLKNISIGILIVVFILGFFALFNKKISKKSKWIIVISLIIIIITTLIIKYFSTL